MMSTNRLTALTPAKINLGLEITGLRDDGYHNVVSILQAIDIYDDFIWEATGRHFQYHGPDEIPRSEDLVNRVIRAAQETEIWTGRLSIKKNIPVAAGLGGGSSDAALAIRIADYGTPKRVLHEWAARYGADVPFLVRGGTVLATGTGTTLEPLPSAAMWFVIIVPSVRIVQKTRTLYSGLSTEDYTDGSTVYDIASAIRAGSPVTQQIPNAFVRQLLAYRGFADAYEALENAGARNITASGAGPSVLAVFHHHRQAARVADQLKGGFERVFLARAISEHTGDSAVIAMARALRGDSVSL